MAASYPASVRLFPARRDVVDVVFAEHLNSLQEEMAAVQAHIGLLPHVSTTPSPTGTFIASASIFSSLSARLANIETGIVADSHTQYLRRAGGETIQPSAADVRGLTVRARADQTGSLLRLENSDGATAYLRVTAAGATELTALSVSGATALTGNATVGGTLAVVGNLTEAGQRVYSPNNPPPAPEVQQLSYSDALPSTGPRAAGTATTVSRGDHSHGPSSTKAFGMTTMGA